MSRWDSKNPDLKLDPHRVDRQWRWWWQRSLLGCWGFRWWCRAQPVQNLHCTADRLTVISNIKKTAKKRRNWNCAWGPAVILILIFQLKLKHFAVGPEADSMETASNWLQEPQTGLQTQRQSQVQIHRKVSIVCTMHRIHNKDNHKYANCICSAQIL